MKKESVAVLRDQIMDKLDTRKQIGLTLGMAGALSLGGVITAVKATPKALELIEEAKKEKRYTDFAGQTQVCEKLTKREIVKTTWKCFIPTVALEAASLGFLFLGARIGLNVELTAKNAAIMAGSYSVMNNVYKEYEGTVKEMLGQETHDNVLDEMAKKRINETPIDDAYIINTHKGDTLCYESLTGRLFLSDKNEIEKALIHAGWVCVEDGWCGISANDYFELLGLEGVDPFGDYFGWYKPFGVTYGSGVTSDGRPYLVVRPDILPELLENV